MRVLDRRRQVDVPAAAAAPPALHGRAWTIAAEQLHRKEGTRSPCSGTGSAPRWRAGAGAGGRSDPLVGVLMNSSECMESAVRGYAPRPVSFTVADISSTPPSAVAVTCTCAPQLVGISRPSGRIRKSVWHEPASERIRKSVWHEAGGARTGRHAVPRLERPGALQPGRSAPARRGGCGDESGARLVLVRVAVPNLRLEAATESERDGGGISSAYRRLKQRPAATADDGGDAARTGSTRGRVGCRGRGGYPRCGAMSGGWNTQVSSSCSSGASVPRAGVTDQTGSSYSMPSCFGTAKLNCVGSGPSLTSSTCCVRRSPTKTVPNCSRSVRPAPSGDTISSCCRTTLADMSSGVAVGFPFTFTSAMQRCMPMSELSNATLSRRKHSSESAGPRRPSDGSIVNGMGSRFTIWKSASRCPVFTTST